ncbi:MAG: GNAT family N-acetyltransferase, partial [Aeoliella sp.]
KLQTDRGDVVEHDLTSRSFVVHESDEVIAHSAVFVRTIGTSSGDLRVAALAQVCADANHRGKNLGVAVTRAVFALVDEGLVPFSLFQTSEEVKPFYERLGCAAIENRIVNSLADDPTKCPFWDGVTMIYPASRDDWPAGDIDLLGPGY